MSDTETKSDFHKFASDNQFFLEMLSSSVADSAIEKIDRNAATMRQRNAVFLTVGGALIVTGLTGVATLFSGSLQESARLAAIEAAQDTVRNEIPTIVQEAQTTIENSLNSFVAENTRQAKRSWSDSRALLTISAMTQEIDDNRHFSEGQAKALLDLITPFAHDRHYTQFADFTPVLEGVIDAFVQAERNDLVAVLEQGFGDLMLEKQETVFSMVVGLGRELIVANFDPEGVSDDKLLQDWNKLRARYNNYADAARNLNLPELPYVFDLIVSCMLGKPEAEQRAYVFEIEKFTDEEREAVLRLAVNAMTDQHASNFARERAQQCIQKLEDFDTTKTLEKAMNSI